MKELIIILAVICGILLVARLLLAGLRNSALFRRIVWGAIIIGGLYWLGLKTLLGIIVIVLLLGAISYLYEKIMQ